MIDVLLHSTLKEIRVFSPNKKKEDIRISYKNHKLNFVIGDIRNFDDTNQVVMGVDFVYHLALLKQVSSCEFYSMNIVKANIIDADNLLEAAAYNNIIRVVVFSMDKTVYPINAIGIFKIMMKNLLLPKSKT